MKNKDAEPAAELKVILDKEANRYLQIGDSWEEFDGMMRLYFPDESQRAAKYLLAFQGLVQTGRVSDMYVVVTPSQESGLDLTDERIAQELFNETGE
jgi:hypothetical protein